MTLSGWIAEFCQRHERYRQGTLSEEELAAYRGGREDLKTVLLAGQRLAFGGKAETRLSIRVSQAFPVELHLPGGIAKSLTIDLGVGGMSARIPHPLALGDRVRFKLNLSRVMEVSGEAQVVHVEQAQGAAKMACKFEGLEEADRFRLEDALFDSVVAQLRLVTKRG